MKKIFTLSIASFLVSFIGFTQQFTKITGSAVTHLQEGIGGTWGDYDNDGFMDVVVSIDPWPESFRPPQLLFHNNGNGTFSQAPAGDNPIGNGGGHSWADYDNDGNLDVYARGNRYTGPNHLYHNEGNGTFTKVPDAGGLNSLVHNNGGVAWGDYDNDGDLDVYMSAFLFGNLLYKNNENGTFSLDTAEIITRDISVESYGAAWADYDNDGDLDLYVSNAAGEWENFFYRNNGGSNHWLDVKCKGTSSNRDAIGARIYAKASIGGQPIWQMREINTNLSVKLGGLGAGGIGPLNQHFGLGDATVIDSLRIVWPVSGITQVFTNVSPDRFIEITEGANAIADAMPCRPDLLPENPAVVTGKVFSDTDNDCLFNSSNDFPVANRIMQANPGPHFVFSSSGGDYEFRLNGGAYNITQATIANDIWNLQTCQPNNSYTVSVNNGDTAVGKIFALQPLPLASACCVDVTITSIPFLPGPCIDPEVLTGPCPTFEHIYCIVIKNCGTSSLPANSVLTIALDPDMTFVQMIASPPSYPPGCNIISGTFPTFNMGAMPPGDECSVCFKVSVNIGSLPPWTTCATYDAACDTDTDCATDNTSCPCDPNDKLGAPKGCGPFHNIGKNEPLTYRIRFQNIGGTPAKDIVIRDVMDDDLDLTTFQILSSSHFITHVEIIPENQLLISYEGINLPDSASDPIGSNGFVVFRILPKNNVVDGTEITNQAGIYFDFNEVVLTNSTLNTLRDNPEPVADFTSKHSCANTGLVYDFFYTGTTPDNATFLWDFGTDAIPQTSTLQNPQGILFSGDGDKDVTLTITRFGCTASITETVSVESIICGKNKILVCHKPPGNPNNPQTICISKNALNAHLQHGDCIGSCGTSTAKISAISDVDSEAMLEIKPNPVIDYSVISFMALKDDNINVTIYDYMGRKVKTLYDGKTSAGVLYDVHLNTMDLSHGVYFVALQTHAEKIVRKVVVIRVP